MIGVTLDGSSLFWILAGVQVAGLLSTLLARCTVGCRGQRPCQWLFVICLTLVGASTVAAMGVSPAGWLFSATTLAAMIVVAVWDVSGRSPVAAR